MARLSRKSSYAILKKYVFGSHLSRSILMIIFLFIVLVTIIFIGEFFPRTYKADADVALNAGTSSASTVSKKSAAISVLNSVTSNSTQHIPVIVDTAAYDAKMLQIANRGTATTTVTYIKVPAPVSTSTSVSTGTSTAVKKPTKSAAPKFITKKVEVPKTFLWPAQAAQKVYPLEGAILPFKRIVAYYGNLYSKQMGVLGEYSEDEMLRRLNIEVKKWEAADPATPVVPALHYIAITAQGSAGKDGKYRLRMPDDQIDKVIAIASKINALVFLDIQVGLSNVQTEVPLFEKYLKMPNVHFGIDPEFSMKTGAKPGTVIGSYDAADINFVSDYLAKIVKENNLPPKILIVHRFTQPMVTHYKDIKLRPEVQIVMDMDGWGSPAHKKDSYDAYIYKEPVQFTGFKLFYKNDLRAPSTHMMTPAEVLELSPQPLYIQYQ